MNKREIKQFIKEAEAAEELDPAEDSFEKMLATMDKALSKKDFMEYGFSLNVKNYEDDYIEFILDLPGNIENLHEILHSAKEDMSMATAAGLRERANDLEITVEATQQHLAWCEEVLAKHNKNKQEKKHGEG